MIKNNHSDNLNWEPVKKALEEGSNAGYKMAIIETDKILTNILKNYPGKTREAKIEFVKGLIARPHKLEYASSLKEKIITEPGFDISKEDTKQIIAAYWQATNELKEKNQPGEKKLDLLKTLQLKLKRLCPWDSLPCKKILISFFSFFLFILFLADTSPGQKLTARLVDIAHFLYFKLLLWVGIFGVVVLAAYFFIFYLSRRKD